MDTEKLKEAKELLSKAQQILKVQWEKLENSGTDSDSTMVLSDIIGDVSSAVGQLSDVIGDF